MAEEHTEKEALVGTKDLEDAWNTTKSPKNNNVRKNYINNPKKNKQYKIMDMGAYCVLNNITPDMLRLFVEYGKKITELVAGVHQSEESKLVVMSKEDFKAYEDYKKFKAFQESQK